MRIEQRRRRISARQRAHLVERLQSSGLTRVAFARRYSVGLSAGFGEMVPRSARRLAPTLPGGLPEVPLAGVDRGSRGRLGDQRS